LSIARSAPAPRHVVAAARSAAVPDEEQRASASDSRGRRERTGIQILQQRVIARAVADRDRYAIVLVSML
jgi:hypothetical protein